MAGIETPTIFSAELLSQSKLFTPRAPRTYNEKIAISRPRALWHLPLEVVTKILFWIKQDFCYLKHSSDNDISNWHCVGLVLLQGIKLFNYNRSISFFFESFSGKLFYLSLNPIGQMVSTLFQNFFKSGAWLSIFTAQNAL